MPDLIQAAETVAPDSPAFDTVTFHAIRLKIEAGRRDEARRQLDKLLAETHDLDSFDNAESDFEARQIIEARLEADTILSALAKAKSNVAWTLITDHEKAAIESARERLVAIQPTGNLAAIRSATTDLNLASTNLAEKMMEAAVSGAMRGKTMQSAGEALANEEIHAPHAFAPAEIHNGK